MLDRSRSDPPGTWPWRWAYRVLWFFVLLTAALNMLRVRGGFLTNHCADLAVPALLYVILRRYPLHTRRGTIPRVRRLLGSTPELAAASIFGASAATEVAQRFWPRGLFPGTFDPLDIAAYGLSVGLCYLADRWATRQAAKHRTGTSSVPA